jgi:hypothetical protein
MHAFFLLAAVTLTPGATVSVSGVAQHVQSGTGRHPYTMYDLCDASEHCVHIVHFGTVNVATDRVQTATGMFRRLVFVDGRHVLDAVVIGRP